jgi:hypothetical protein
MNENMRHDSNIFSGLGKIRDGKDIHYWSTVLHFHELMSNIRVSKLPFVIFSVYHYASNEKLVYTKDVAGWRRWEGVSHKL